jgi:hypothetical protein
MASVHDDHSDEGYPEVFYLITIIGFLVITYVIGFLWDSTTEPTQHFTRRTAVDLTFSVVVANTFVLFSIAYLVSPELKDWQRYRRRSAYVATTLSNVSVMIACYGFAQALSALVIDEFALGIVFVVFIFGVVPCIAIARVAVHHLPRPCQGATR